MLRQTLLFSNESCGLALNLEFMKTPSNFGSCYAPFALDTTHPNCLELGVVVRSLYRHKRPLRRVGPGRGKRVIVPLVPHRRQCLAATVRRAVRILAGCREGRTAVVVTVGNGVNIALCCYDHSNACWLALALA